MASSYYATAPPAGGAYPSGDPSSAYGAYGAPPPQPQQQPPQQAAASKPIADLDDLFDFGRPAGAPRAAPAAPAGPPAGPPPPLVGQDPFGYSPAAAPPAAAAPPSYGGYGAAPTPSGYPSVPPAGSYGGQMPPGVQHYPPQQQQPTMTSAAPSTSSSYPSYYGGASGEPAGATSVGGFGSYGGSGYGMSTAAAPTSAPPQPVIQQGSTVPSYPPAGSGGAPLVTGSVVPVGPHGVPAAYYSGMAYPVPSAMPSTSAPPASGMAYPLPTAGGPTTAAPAFPMFSHPGLAHATPVAPSPYDQPPQASYPQPSLSMGSGVPTGAGGSSFAPVAALSQEEADRQHLEKIRKLRQELEREQQREKEALEEKQSWPCSQCTLRNPLTSQQCSACDAPRPGYTATAPTRTSSLPPTVASTPAPAAPPATPKNTWVCRKCAATNSDAANLCKICDTPMPGTEGLLAPGGGGAAGLSTTPAPAAAKTEWPCSNCTLLNPVARPACDACGSARPAAFAPAAAAPLPPSGMMPYSVATPAPATAATTSWSCPQCTFANPVSRPRCEMCATAIPAHIQAAAQASIPPPGTMMGMPPAPRPGGAPTPAAAQQPVMSFKIQMPPGLSPAQQHAYAQQQAMIRMQQQQQQAARGGMPPTGAGVAPGAVTPPATDEEDADIQWQKDHDAVACTKCGNAFSLVNRRHHCRSCGFVFCNTCCWQRLKLKPTGKDERHCVDCYKEKTSPHFQATAPAAPTVTRPASAGVMPAMVPMAPAPVAPPPTGAVAGPGVPANCDCAMGAEGFHRTSCPYRR